MKINEFDGFKHVKYFNDVMHFINIELIKFGIFGIGLIITIVNYIMILINFILFYFFYFILFYFIYLFILLFIYISLLVFV